MPLVVGGEGILNQGLLLQRGGVDCAAVCPPSNQEDGNQRHGQQDNEATANNYNHCKPARGLVFYRRRCSYGTSSGGHKFLKKERKKAESKDTCKQHLCRRAAITISGQVRVGVGGGGWGWGENGPNYPVTECYTVVCESIR